MRSPIHLRRPVAAVAASALLALTPACGSVITSVEGEYSDPVTIESSAAERLTADVIVTGVDYAFAGIPAMVPDGASIGFTNASATEAHELVVFPIPDDETRGVEELWRELDDSSEPVLVSVAAPGGDGRAYVGDGTINGPGRYLAVCFLPVGTDPETIFEQDGPPDSDAPPHAANGMVAEIVVEA